MVPKVEITELLTVTQAANLLQISSAAIHKAIKRDRLRYLRLGGIFLIKRSDLVHYSNTKSVGGRPKKPKRFKASTVASSKRRQTGSTRMGGKTGAQTTH